LDRIHYHHLGGISIDAEKSLLRLQLARNSPVHFLRTLNMSVQIGMQDSVVEIDAFDINVQAARVLYYPSH
jgi:hypothetical protein